MQQKTLYDYLSDLPEGVTGEILNGQLYAHPRPHGRHILAASSITSQFFGPYHGGRGGPGGWWILTEPEIHFELDRAVCVPDIAGWRREHMPSIPDGHKFEIAPDWICEILSPSTESIDREVKMPLYAKYGVAFLWLVHPIKMTLEAYALRNKQWHLQAVIKADDPVCLLPFDSTSFKLRDLLGVE
jgi:Uma2 family endonuclease